MTMPEAVHYHSRERHASACGWARTDLAYTTTEDPKRATCSTCKEQVDSYDRRTRELGGLVQIAWDKRRRALTMENDDAK
jgi:hypothetical protein